MDPLTPAVYSLLAGGGIKGTVKRIQAGLFMNSPTSLWKDGSSTSIDYAYQDITVEAVVPENCLVSAIDNVSKAPLTARMINATTLRISIGVANATAKGTWTLVEYTL